MDMKEILSSDLAFRYDLLARLRSDCSYYLGAGHQAAEKLWAKNEQDQIRLMKAIWNSFGETEKPEWISFGVILSYEQQMIHKKEPLYIFDEELLVEDEARECIDAYVWAVDALVDRAQAVASKDLTADELETMENINFYPTWNLRTNAVELQCCFWYSPGENALSEMEMTHRTVQLPVPDEDAHVIRREMDNYCRTRYGKDCLGFLNEIRTEDGLCALNYPPAFLAHCDSLSQQAAAEIDTQMDALLGKGPSGTKTPLDAQIFSAAEQNTGIPVVHTPAAGIPSR